MMRTLMYKEKSLAEIFIADTFVKRLTGYMFRSTPQYEAILFKPCDSIHTFFMHFPIDVLFVNKEMKVIKKIENLEPSKIVLPVKGTQMIIEGSAGLFHHVIAESEIELV